MEKQPSYEEALKELGDIVIKLESGSLPLSEATELFERGKKLVKICYNHLDKAKGKLTEIKETLSGLEED